jgi:hypothetical protein
MSPWMWDLEGKVSQLCSHYWSEFVMKRASQAYKLNVNREEWSQITSISEMFGSPAAGAPMVIRIAIA